MTATTAATMALNNKARIVLIEDNPADVLLVREAIRERGLAVELISYTDVPEAIAGLGNPGNPLPDAILAILTSSQSPRDREQAQRLQVQWYIHKPSTLQEFLSTVGGAVRELLDSSPRFRKQT
jgi:CheY-like chemotaxis protein